MKSLVTVFLLLWSAGGYATFYNSEQLNALCDGTFKGEPNVNESKYYLCTAFLAGLSDANEAFQEWGVIEPHICLPVGISAEAFRQVWLRQIRNHPEDLDKTAASVAILAFGAAWPCPRN